jgi:hypothetical protein
MASQEPREIDWSSAEIEDARLSVALSGSGSKAWKGRFQNVLALLDTPHSGWGEVRLTGKGVIRVRDVRPGAESDLRHFLETVLLQVNSDTVPAGTQPAEQDVEDEPQEPDPDEQMTAAFRAFATDRG